MTYRANDPFIKNCYSQSESRLNQQIRYDATDEGCPVIESGTICGETNSFDIFEEFRQIYNDCIKKLEECQDDNSTVKKLAPFRKLVEDLWEQNALLVEAVVELEQEATCTVSNLQDKLKKSCQKVAANLKNIFNSMNEYKEDIKSLVEIVKKYSGSSTFDFKGIKFKTDNVLSMWEDDECSTSKYLSYDETCKFDSSTLPGKYSIPQQTMKMKGLICTNKKNFNENISIKQFRNEDLESPELSTSDCSCQQNNSRLTSNLEAFRFSDEVHAKETCFNCLKTADLYKPNKYQEPVKQIHFHINMRSDTISETNSCCNCDCIDEN